MRPLWELAWRSESTSRFTRLRLAFYTFGLIIIILASWNLRTKHYCATGL